MDRRAHVVAEAGEGQLGGPRPTAHRVAGLQQHHRPPRPGQGDGRGQPVRARPNHHGVVPPTAAHGGIWSTTNPPSGPIRTRNTSWNPSATVGTSRRRCVPTMLCTGRRCRPSRAALRSMASPGPLSNHRATTRNPASRAGPTYRLRSATVGLVLSTTNGCRVSRHAARNTASRCRVLSRSRLIRTWVDAYRSRWNVVLPLPWIPQNTTAFTVRSAQPGPQGTGSSRTDAPERG